MVGENHAGCGGVSRPSRRQRDPSGGRAKSLERDIRFDTIEHLYAWTQSETRRELVAEIAPYLNDGDRTEIRTEPAFWFTPPAANIRQPLRWKQFLITLLVIFPSTNLVPWLTGMALPELRGSLLLHLINDALVVALVVWLWMPIVTRLFAGWLKKN